MSVGKSGQGSALGTSFVDDGRSFNHHVYILFLSSSAPSHPSFDATYHFLEDTSLLFSMYVLGFPYTIQR